MSIRIRKHRSGAWEVDAIVRLPSGERVRKRIVSPLTGHSATVRWARALEEELLTKGLKQKPAAAPTLEAFAPRYLEHCAANRQKPSALARKASILRIHLLPRFGAKRLSEIHTRDVEELKTALAGAAPSTVNNVVSVLGNMLRRALEWGELAEMPCTVRLVRRPEHEMVFRDFDEFERLVAAARELGWRAELVRSSRRSGVPRARRAARRTSTRLRSRSTSTQRSHGYVPLVEEVHALRHTFGAHLAMRGAPPKAIQVALRHRDLHVTQRYLHLSPAALEEAVSLLEPGQRSRGLRGA